MILVDTSVWIDHLRRRNDRLAERLEAGEVLGHEYVIGEVACGNLRNRREVLTLLANLPQASLASHEEILKLIESRGLSGRGLGYVDVQLLASAMLDRSPLWTLGRRLAQQARRLGVSA